MGSPEGLFRQGDRHVVLTLNESGGCPSIPLHYFVRELGDRRSPSSTLDVHIPGFGCPPFPDKNGFRSYGDSTELALHREEEGAHTLLTFVTPGSTRDQAEVGVDHSLNIDAYAFVELMKRQVDSGLFEGKTNIRFQPHSRGVRIFLEAMQDPTMRSILGELTGKTKVKAILHMPAFSLQKEGIHNRIAILARLRNSLLGDEINHLPSFAKRLVRRDLEYFGYISDKEGYFNESIVRSNLHALEAHAKELLGEYDPCDSLHILGRFAVPVDFIFAGEDKMVAHDEKKLMEDMLCAEVGGTIAILQGAFHTEHLRNPQRMAHVVTVLEANDNRLRNAYSVDTSPQGDLFIHVPRITDSGCPE